MPKITTIAHLLLQNHIKTGDIVVDATCGNGHDTLFLAQLVGNSGLVHAYDIQKEAIENTKNLTKDYDNIIFHLESHENINIDNVSAVIFNLGYLPSGNKEITTKLNSTKKAITQLLKNLNHTMLILIVVYPGHEEGKLESDWLTNNLSHLDTSYLVAKYEVLNQNNAPYILTINKKK